MFFSPADLCSAEHLPEVEIISLLEEQIPKYKLRADALTEFIGYENQVSGRKNVYIFFYGVITLWNINGSEFLFFTPQDWFVPSPALKIPAEGLALNKDQIRETLNYFREYHFVYSKYFLAAF